MKRIVSIAPRKLKNALKETKQIIRQTTLNSGMWNQKQIREKKIRVEILGDSMLNGGQEKGLNKNADINIKIRKYHGAPSTEILDHIRPSLRKEPDKIIIHAGTNNLTDDHNYLNNLKLKILNYLNLTHLWKTIVSSKT